MFFILTSYLFWCHFWNQWAKISIKKKSGIVWEYLNIITEYLLKLTPGNTLGVGDTGLTKVTVLLLKCTLSWKQCANLAKGLPLWKCLNNYTVLCPGPLTFRCPIPWRVAASVQVSCEVVWSCPMIHIVVIWYQDNHARCQQTEHASSTHLKLVESIRQCSTSWYVIHRFV